MFIIVVSFPGLSPCPENSCGIFNWIFQAFADTLIFGILKILRLVKFIWFVLLFIITSFALLYSYVL
jgi:hypothetical protein